VIPAPGVRGLPTAGAVRLHTNHQLLRLLTRLKGSGAGRVGVRRIGQSNEGRPICLATVGSGPIRMLYLTQQHGDEPLGTEAAVHALRALGLARSAWARAIRVAITLGIVIRVNPDGHERNWRVNYAPDREPRFGEAGRGHDVNRYHHPGLSTDSAIAAGVPEAAAVHRAWQALRPSIVVDFHMQDRYLLPSGQEITTSVMWPTSSGIKPNVLDRSLRASVVLRDTFVRGRGVVSRYPGEAYEGIARNAYGINGAASVLVELSSIPGREGFQVASACRSMIALAAAVAAGSDTLDRFDPAAAEAIPPRGPALRFPRQVPRRQA
jgi:hypothetical protein